MKFSQRHGIVPTTKPIQVDSMDDDLRNGLWNGIKIYLIDSQSKSDIHGYDNGNTNFAQLCNTVFNS